MGSSLKALGMENLAVKTNLNFDDRFKSYSFLKFWKHKLNACTWDFAEKSRDGRMRCFSYALSPLYGSLWLVLIPQSIRDNLRERDEGQECALETTKKCSRVFKQLGRYNIMDKAYTYGCIVPSSERSLYLFEGFYFASFVCKKWETMVKL